MPCTVIWTAGNGVSNQEVWRGADNAGVGEFCELIGTVGPTDDQLFDPDGEPTGYVYKIRCLSTQGGNPSTFVAGTPT